MLFWTLRCAWARRRSTLAAGFSWKTWTYPYPAAPAVYSKCFLHVPLTHTHASLSHTHACIGVTRTHASPSPAATHPSYLDPCIPLTHIQACLVPLPTYFSDHMRASLIRSHISLSHYNDACSWLIESVDNVPQQLCYLFICFFFLFTTPHYSSQPFFHF